MYFWTYQLLKTLLDKCLKSPVSEVPSTSNMVNVTEHCSKLKGSSFAIFIDHFEGIQFEKTSLSGMQNLRTLC